MCVGPPTPDKSDDGREYPPALSAIPLELPLQLGEFGEVLVHVAGGDGGQRTEMSPEREARPRIRPLAR